MLDAPAQSPIHDRTKHVAEARDRDEQPW